MRNILLVILTFSILMAGFGQAIDVLSFQTNGYYLSHDHLKFAKHDYLVYCGGAEVLHKELKEHNHSSDNFNNQVKKEFQLNQQHNFPKLDIHIEKRQEKWGSILEGIPIHRPQKIFHPPAVLISKV